MKLIIQPKRQLTTLYLTLTVDETITMLYIILQRQDCPAIPMMHGRPTFYISLTQLWEAITQNLASSYQSKLCNRVSFKSKNNELEACR